MTSDEKIQEVIDTFDGKQRHVVTTCEQHKFGFFGSVMECEFCNSFLDAEGNVTHSCDKCGAVLMRDREGRLISTEGNFCPGVGWKR